MTPFIPKWAEDAQNQPSVVHDEVELETLRDFFLAWCAFHGVPKDKAHRKQQETAAQLMTEKAQMVLRLQNPGAKLRINGMNHG